MTNFKPVIRAIEQHTATSISSYNTTAVSGGCINSAYRLYGDGFNYFIKLNQIGLLDMFEAEAAALAEFEQMNCVRVPRVICCGVTTDNSYLVLEYMDLTRLGRSCAQTLGIQLAQLHHQSQGFYGWHRDNTIGSTPQINTKRHNWVLFWQRDRLGQQLEFAQQNGFGSRLQDKGARLMEQIDSFFESYTPEPVLLHGDLWGGNAAADSRENPVLFDPASYYGDRETDIAMTELFGGFGSGFYSAYQAEYPLDKGYNTRKTLYNLYHIINHVNLFGSGYLGQAENMMDQLLAEVK